MLIDLNKYLIIVITFIALFISCKPEVKKEKIAVIKPIKLEKPVKIGYSIDGFTDVDSNDYIYLLNTKKEKLDSVIPYEKEFSFKGSTAKPEQFYLNFQNEDHPFIIENENFKVFLREASINIHGGNLNDKLSIFHANQNEIANRQNKAYQKFKFDNFELDEYLENVEALHNKRKKNTFDFILENQNNILARLVLEQEEFDSKEIEDLVTKINPSKNRVFYDVLKSFLHRLKQEEAKNKILRRKPAPLFYGVNLSGSQSSLQDLIKGKKAFLIDFWASWCPPCRDSSPRIRQLYTTYFPRGFDVLTVSEDRSVNEWKNGIFLDGIESWNHIYDDYNRISNLYGVTSLPHLVLIDENGKIIKNKISIDDLELELEKIFKP